MPDRNMGRLRRFIADFGDLLGAGPDEGAILVGGRRLLGELVRQDDWLPQAFAEPAPDRYRQYLLHCDSRERFSVVSFVWGPGQATPIHNHTVWGLVGVLRGAEIAQRYAPDGDGVLRAGHIDRLEVGDVEVLSPRAGDIHRVVNAFDDRVSISIHVYGANIGAVRRSTFDLDGRSKPFISGYANTVLPNVWDAQANVAQTVAPGSSPVVRPPASPTVTPAEVRADLIARREIALLDLREEDPYAKDHPLFAANLPLGRLEIEALDRIPRKDAPIVIYYADEGLTATAVERLQALGYSDVRVLEGGLEGWRGAGYELFQDVNSASKAFGELVEARRHTPSLSAVEVKALIDHDPDVVVLDARRFDEYQTMSIPRGVSVPGAELVLRARALAPDPKTRIVVNCAGRTRSIVGAQSLINAGLPNPVYALRNGAIGWTLAGLELDHGQGRRFPDVDGAQERQAREAARETAYRAGVKRLTAQELTVLSTDRARTLYRFDVRTPDEYAAGHIGGFRSAPGGQLVQETDMFAPVRGARLVLADDRGVRADMTASWLAQMGWEVYVLEGGFDGPLQTGGPQPEYPQLPEAKLIGPAALQTRIETGDVVVLDLGPSAQFKRGHIPGAWFALRSRLADALPRLPAGLNIVLASPDGALAAFAAPEVERLTGAVPHVLEGGVRAWVAAGLPVEPGFSRALSPPIDRYNRPYEGADHAAEAKQAYLDWEYGLVDQLRRDATHGFFVI